MIRIDYVFKAIAPIHTGSDQDTGIMKTLRRQKVVFDPHTYETALSETDRLKLVVEILYGIYKSIGFSDMPKSRLLGMWDEMYSIILKSASVPNKYAFVDRFCKAWGIRSVDDVRILDYLEMISDAEFLECLREETHLIVLMLRRRTKNTDDLFTVQNDKIYKYVKTYEMVPCIAGNSIRGALRRLAMYDFCQRVGITKLSKKTYHCWFTGGALDSDAQTLDIDMDKRAALIRSNPMLAVFGTALGNQTFEGMMSVGHAYPMCRELNTGDRSYWEYLDIIFQTKLDSSKTEAEIEIVDDTGDITTQMKYEYEVFAPGTPFKHGFRMMDFDPLSVSAFWHVVSLFKQNPIICGHHARGNAEIDLSTLPSGDDEQYIEYLEINKDFIKESIEI